MPFKPAVQAGWGVVVGMALAVLLLQLCLDFAIVGRGGEWMIYGLPAALFFVPVLILAAWAVARFAARPGQALPLLVVFCAITFWSSLAGDLAQWSLAQGWIRNDPLGATAHAIESIRLYWLGVACGVAAFRQTGVGRRAGLAMLLLANVLITAPLILVDSSPSMWIEAYEPVAEDDQAQRNAAVSEEALYLQPALLQRELDGVQARRSAHPQVFLVVAAGDAGQDVFMKEADYVADLFRERFGTEGHTVTLINNPGTATSVPIASVTSLQLALDRVGAVMDPAKDILFLYLTSHGSKEHKFALEFGGLQFQDLDPPRLRAMLDKSKIRHRVLVISACYAGGFVEPLKNDDTLVIAAAAADRTSFGCSNEADFTYFGKAYFEEALGKTNSFIAAFDLAAASVAAREKAEAIDASLPQMHVGANIRGRLAQFERTLPAGLPVSGQGVIAALPHGRTHP